jgi:hypothetical protein
MATEKETKTEVKLETTKRKVIQITSSPTNTGRTIVVALCNDGTIWWRDAMSVSTEWTRIMDV